MVLTSAMRRYLERSAGNAELSKECGTQAVQVTRCAKWAG